MSKNFTASLHPKSNLSTFLSKWRGRPVLPGETIGLEKLIGACCTLVISHQQNMSGKTYAAIDAVSKPTKKVTPSGTYDPAAARQRYADWQAKQTSPTPGNLPAPTAPAPVAAAEPRPPRATHCAPSMDPRLAAVAGAARTRPPVRPGPTGEIAQR